MIKSEKGLYLWIFLKMDPFLLLKKDLAFKVWLCPKAFDSLLGRNLGAWMYLRSKYPLLHVLQLHDSV